MLVRCLYASRAAQDIDTAKVDAILQQSRRNNPKSGITGMLLFANGVFVQVIEGGRGAVNQLLCSIIRDARNTNVEILSFEEIGERRFGKWNMGQVNIGSVNPAILLKYSEKPELDPFACPAATTLELLAEIAETGSIAHRST